MESGATSGQLEVSGRVLNIRHLHRVIFPESGTTKGELLDRSPARLTSPSAHVPFLSRE